MKKVLAALIPIVLTVAGLFLFLKQNRESYPEDVYNLRLEKIKGKENLIRVEEPLPLAIVKNGFFIKGQARGNWYFEASFPVSLIDEKGNTVVNSYLEAIGEWMREDFVAFEKEFFFESEPQSKYGLLILKKDNPSGLPEQADQIEIPVRFR